MKFLINIKQILFTLFLSIGIAPQLAAMEDNKPLPEILDRLLLHYSVIGDVCEMRRVLDLGANIEARDKHADETPLILAVSKGHPEAVEFLLDNGADPNNRTKTGDTALTYCTNATGKIRLKIFKLLLDHGVQVNAQNENGGTALFYQAQQDPASCLLLMEHGADPTLRFHTENTPLLHSAKYCKHVPSYIPIIQGQYRINRVMEITLLCLNRIKRDPSLSEKIRISAGELYRQFNTLLRPYLGNYIPLKQLLNMQDNNGKRAFDHKQIDWLNPDKIYEMLEPKPTTENSKCSIQ